MKILVASSIRIAILLPMLTTPTSKLASGTQGRELIHAYNHSHPESRCAVRPHRSVVLGHKFKTESKERIRAGVFRELSRCVFCGNFVRSEVDYGILSGVFSLPA